MSIYSLAKKEVLDIKPYEPGKPIQELSRELGLSDIIKIASNENPLGPSKKAVEAMTAALAAAHLYPDGGAFYLKEKLSKKFGVEKKNIILGNGSSEILEMIAQAFLNEGENVLTCWPTFLIYSIIAKIAKAKMVRIPLKDFTFDLDAIAEAKDVKTKIIIICNPNNPTGTYVDKKILDRFIKKAGGNVLIVIDEAYQEFAEEEKDFPKSLEYIKSYKNVIVIRTFSKIAGMAGLRLGYGFAGEEIIEILNRVRPPFNVNSVAQAGAVAALDDSGHIKETLKLVREGKKFLYDNFARMGLEYVRSAANFILVKVGKGKEVFDALLKKGVIIRAMDAFELPGYIRVTVGTAEQNQRFVDGLKDVLGGKP